MKYTVTTKAKTQRPGKGPDAEPIVVPPNTPVAMIDTDQPIAEIILGMSAGTLAVDKVQAKSQPRAAEPQG